MPFKTNVLVNEKNTECKISVNGMILDITIR